MDKENKSESNNPGFPYGNTIRVFRSFEEANANSYFQWSQLTPQVRLQSVCDMLIAAYGEKILANPAPYFGTDIIFDDHVNSCS